MPYTIEFKGLIAENHELHDGSGLYIIPKNGRFGSPFAQEFPSSARVNVRYALSETGVWPETLDEVAADELSLLEGASKSVYYSRYSELTGYLWTEEEAKVGGHDLLLILKGNVGRYLWMEVEYER